MAYARRPKRLMSLEDYLAFEEKSPIKHEFVAGEVHAMTGTTTRHNLIEQNVVRKLHPAARARGCRVFAEAVKLKAVADRIYYPDVIVACGPAAEVELIVEEALIVVEISSPSTRATDRREKLDAYQRMPALQVYLIVEQRWRKVVAYQRDVAGEWLKSEFEGEGEIQLSPLATRLTLDEIYDDVPMPPLAVKDAEWEEERANEAELARWLEEFRYGQSLEPLA